MIFNGYTIHTYIIDMAIRNTPTNHIAYKGIPLHHSTHSLLWLEFHLIQYSGVLHSNRIGFYTATIAANCRNSLKMSICRCCPS